MTDFSSLAISPIHLQVLAELGLTQMTPVQAQTIPLQLEGRDVIGQSKTGSGKTIAFGLPIVEKLNPAERSLQALILCPTRELCTQVAREIRRIGRRIAGLQVQILSGGQPLRAQIASLANGIQIAVATPGRLLDHLRRQTVTMERVKTLVLDEADRMLDMGFLEDIEAIIELVPKDRQTVLFSATFESSIATLSRRFQREPVRVTIDGEADEPLKIRQLFYEISDESAKTGALIAQLQTHRPISALIFCRLKQTAHSLAQSLCDSGLSAIALHGDLEQRERDRAMALFRNHSVRLLVATDVAARGLDIVDLDLVVNFDLPSNSELYLHRIGRTGRAGKTGLAIAFGIARENAKLDAYERLTGAPIERMPHEELAPVLAIDLEAPMAAHMATLHIWGGRKDKLRPGDILGALTGDLGLAAADIGKIEILDRLAYVAVSAHLARNAARKLREGHIKGRKFRVDVI